MSLFEDHREAEEAYKKITSAHAMCLIGHQHTTGVIVGCLEGMAQTAMAQKEAGKAVDRDRLIEMAVLSQILKIREKEFEGMLKFTNELKLPMPQIKAQEATEMIERGMAKSRKAAAATMDEEGRKGTMDDLMKGLGTLGPLDETE